MDYKELWNQIKENIRAKNQRNDPFISFINTISFEFEENAQDRIRFRLGVPSDFHKKKLKDLLPVLTSEISNTYQKPFDVDLFTTGLSEAAKEKKTVFDSTPSSVPQFIGNSTSKKFDLNPEYTFEKFTVAPFNRFPYVLSCSVAESPGTDKSKNPVFIYGRSGMGKTHLLNAIGNSIRKNFPEKRVMYLSFEKFLNNFITHVRFKNMYKFQKKYREETDVLLIDDFQTIQNGDKVQEEFFHTFNHLLDNKKQIVIAADCIPDELKKLQDRIVTRLKGGVVAEIDQPDLESREAILRNKSDELNIQISNEISHYIAKNSLRSIRELEGNLNRIHIFSQLQKMPVNIELVKKLIPEKEQGPVISIDFIQKIVADHYHLRVSDLKSKSRERKYIRGRQMAMHLIKESLGLSLSEIGQAFGNRDHTTVINALRNSEDLLKKNRDFLNTYENLKSLIERA